MPGLRTWAEANVLGMSERPPALVQSSDAEPEIPESSGTRPWQLPRQWVGEASFWRDVATRTISVLISGFIILTFARVSDLLNNPTTKSIVAAVLASFAIPLLGLYLGIKLAEFGYRRRKEDGQMPDQPFSWPAAIGLAAAVFILMFGSAYLVRLWGHI